MPTKSSLSTRVLGLVVWLFLASPGCGDDAGSSVPADADAGVRVPDLSVHFDLPDLDRVADATDATDAADTADTADTSHTGEDPDVAACRADELEPSALRTPTIVGGSDVWTDLTICQFDDDWFEIDLAAGDRLEARMTAPYANGDLDIMLFAPELRILASSMTAGDEEQLVYGAAGQETVLLRVFANGRDENAYALTIDIESFDSDCDDDPEEPNDAPDSALAVESPLELAGRVCVEDVDWFAVDLPAGETLSARVELEHRLGDLDVRLYLDDPDGDLVAESKGDTDFERVEAGPFDTDVRLLLEIYGFRGAANDYVLVLRTLAPPDAAITVSGVVSYEDRPFGAEGFTGERVERPARGFRVELVRAFDGSVASVASTDETGNYGLTAVVHANEAYYLRALSAFEGQTFDVHVEDRSEAEQLYALAGESFAPGSADEHHIDLLASADDPPGGAFNILDVNWDAYTFVRSHTDERGDSLTYRWEPGQAFSCGSCYFNNVISLGGQVEDTDEYDDDIVLHEFGHYFQDNFSADDSPGGRHNGEQLSPLLAYGEGMATFFSSMVQDDPEYVDIYIDSLRLRDLESANEDPEQFYGTDGGELTDDVSEYLVAAVMWDTIDDASEAEPFDTLERDTADVMTIFSDYMRDPRRPTVGVRGIDLADWLNGMTCTYPDLAESLETLVVEDREFPWDVETDSVCAGKATDTADVEIVRQGDSLWLVGLTEPAVLSVRTDHGAGWTVASHACEPAGCRLPVSTDSTLTVVVTGQVADGAVRTSWLGSAALERLQGSHRPGLSPLGAVREWPSR